MMFRALLAIGLFVTGCESKPSKAEQEHAQQGDRAAEIAKLGIQKWTALVDAAAAATEGTPPPDKATALATIAKAKEAYLAEAKPLREELNTQPKSVLGQVSGELSKFQESDAYKQKVQLIKDRATAYGYDGREVGDAMRELMDYRFVYAVHSEK